MSDALPRSPWMYDAQHFDRVLSALNDRLSRLERPVPDNFTATNVTPDRTYNADSTSTAELADVLGTLISDLQRKGVLK